jgi:hypothetical protein
VYQNGSLQKLIFSGSVWTEAIGINDAGIVVGEFADATNMIAIHLLADYSLSKITVSWNDTM